MDRELIEVYKIYYRNSELDNSPEFYNKELAKEWLINNAKSYWEYQIIETYKVIFKSL